MTIAPVNDAPVNTVPGAQTTNVATPINFTGLSIADLDAGVSSLQATISTTLGTLTPAVGSGATLGGGGSNAVMIAGTLAQINAALNGLEFNPGGTAGTATVTLVTNDQGNTGSGGPQSDTDTLTVTVTPPNTPPVVDLDGTTAGVNFAPTFTEGGGAIAIANTDSTVSDADAGDLVETLTITLTNAPDGAAESLSINGGLPMGITATTLTATSIVLTNGGGATNADMQTALRQIQYNNTSENPNTTPRGVTVVANDGDADSAIATSTLSVVAVNDPPTITPPTYTGNANLTLTVPDGAGDLLDGAMDVEGTAVTVVAATLTSAQAAATMTTADDNNVVVAADGSFTFRPVPGSVGNDTFVYQLQDNGLPTPAATANITATVTLTDLDGAGAGDDILWFIDEDSTGANLGTQADPFRSLAAFNGATTGDGDYVFLDGDTSDNNGDGVGIYGGGIVLGNNQTLIGDGTTGTTLAALTGITLGSFNSLGADFTAFSGTQPVIQNSGGNGVTLGSGNTLRGLDVGDASGVGIQGGAVGTLTIADVAINNATGGGFAVTAGGALSVALDGLTAGGGTNGVTLTGTSGTWSATGGSITGATGTAFNVQNGSANVTYDGAIAGTSGQTTINSANNTGGTQDFNGAITANTGTATAINLQNNTGATLRFDGGLNIDTTSGTGLSAIGGGTLHITGTNNIDTTTGRALTLSSVAIGADGVTLATVDKNNAAGATIGVLIDNVDTGTLTVGSSTIAGTAGTLLPGIRISESAGTFNFGSATVDGTSGFGILLLSNPGDVTFTTVDIDGTTRSAIGIDGNTGSVNINGGTIGATTPIATDSAVDINQAQGDIAIATAITNAADRSIEITNSGGTPANTINFTGAIADTGTGIFLDNNDQNAGATLNFTGGLTLNTGANDAFTATNGGTVTVQGSTNTIATTTGTAVNIQNTTIGTVGGGALGRPSRVFPLMVEPMAFC